MEEEVEVEEVVEVVEVVVEEEEKNKYRLGRGLINVHRIDDIHSSIDFSELVLEQFRHLHRFLKQRRHVDMRTEHDRP